MSGTPTCGGTGVEVDVAGQPICGDESEVGDEEQYRFV